MTLLILTLSIWLAAFISIGVALYVSKRNWDKVRRPGKVKNFHEDLV